MNQFQMPQSIEELKAIVAQFEMFLPEDKRKVINEVIAEIEAAGGIKSKEQMEELTQKLISKLGLPF
ncbi:MAG: hypothetical protein ACOWWO_13590 [Peptococcaceae bacterium]